MSEIDRPGIKLDPNLYGDQFAVRISDGVLRCRQGQISTFGRPVRRIFDKDQRLVKIEFIPQ